MSFYQGDRDVQNEVRIANAIGKSLGVDVVLTEKGASIDYVFYRDGVVCGIGECKSRGGEYSFERMQEIGDVMLDYRKLLIARSISKHLCVNFYFVVELTNKMLYFEVRWNEKFHIETTKKRLRKPRDVNDEDLVALFPIEGFTVIG
jgi:hypothetical protein